MAVKYLANLGYCTLTCSNVTSWSLKSGRKDSILRKICQFNLKKKNQTCCKRAAFFPRIITLRFSVHAFTTVELCNIYLLPLFSCKNVHEDFLSLLPKGRKPLPNLLYDAPVGVSGLLVITLMQVLEILKANCRHFGDHKSRRLLALCI